MTVSIDSLLPAVGKGLDDAALCDHYRAGSGSRWLRANFVSSVDGAVAVDGKSGGLGGEADRRVFDLLRRLSDVVLVGAGTVRAEGYGPMVLDEESVAARVGFGLQPQPVFAIVSAQLELDPASDIFTRAPVRPIVVTSFAAPETGIRALSAVADIVSAGDTEVDLGAAVGALVDRGLSRIHCEGGPTLFGALLAVDLVDELCLTVSPLLAAGDAGRIATGPLTEPRSMGLAGVLRSESTLLLRYLRDRG